MQPQARNSELEPWSDNAPQPRLTLSFPFGLNENASPSLGECNYGYNFDLAYADSSFRPRRSFDLKGTAPNAGQLTGLLQLVKRDATETTLTVNGGQVYLWDGGSTYTAKASVTSPAYLRDAYWSLGEYLVITDVMLNNVVKTWDGTTFTNMTTGLGSALSAKYAFVHLNRVWLFNIKYGSTLYPNMILACKFEDPTVWDTSTRGGASTVGGGVFATGLEAFYLQVPDERPINGVSLFQNQLIISTLNGRMWQLNGTSAKDFQFVDFHDTGPAIGSQAILDIGNDVIFVTQGGDIKLLFATQSYGNALSANLSAWLPTTTLNLSTINAIVYDILHQKVLIFIPGKVLVLFKDILAQDRAQVEGKPSPWSVYITDDASGFNTLSARYMLMPGTTNYSVYFGDSAGRIFDLNGTGSSGDAGSSSVRSLRKSRHIGNEIIQPWPWTQENITGHVRYRRLTAASLTLTLDWDDEYNTMTTVLSLKGPSANDLAPYYGGSYYYNASSYYNQGFNAIGRVGSMNVEPGGKGPGFYLSVSLPTNVSTQIDSVEID